jgi:hypothetical protein
LLLQDATYQLSNQKVKAEVKGCVQQQINYAGVTG